MKRLFKPVLLFMLTAVLTLLPAYGVLAASAPASAAVLSVKKSTKKNVTLTWTKVSDATGYYVYQVGPDTEKVSAKYKVKANQYKVTEIEQGGEYQFYVKAYNSAGESSKASNTVSLTPGYTRPSAPTGLKISEYNSSYRVLSWNAVSGADGYLVYTSDTYSSGGKSQTKLSVKMPDKKTTYCKIEVQKGHTYQFYVMSYKQDPDDDIIIRSTRSIVLKAQYETITIKSVHSWYRRATVKSTTQATASNGSKVTLNAGTSVTATALTSGTVDVILSNGTTVSMSGSNLSYGGLVTTRNRYTTQQAENFVNAGGYSSNTSWLMWCNEYTCVTYIFQGSKENWKCIRAMDSVIGVDGVTKLGVKKITRKGEAYGDVAAFFGGNAFHRRWGTTRGVESHGCVRLGTTDLHYVYDNVPIGTTVVFH